MSQAKIEQDWRRKYFDSIRAIEEEARQHRVWLDTLYRLAGRLCAVAQGQSPNLDAKLKLLRDALRRQAEPGELEVLGESVTETVRELEGTGRSATLEVPAHENDPPDRVDRRQDHDPSGGELRLQELLAQLMADLKQIPQFTGGTDTVRTGILPAATGEQLTGALEQVAGWLMKRIRLLEDERDGLTVLLDQMVGQLDVLNGYVRSNAEEESRRHSSHAALDQQMTGEMRAMGESVQNSGDIELLRQQLTARLSAISRYMQEFRDREEEHARGAHERASRMRARIEQMEGEARELQARLSDEKKQSLTDALTRIPNRAAWDQRIGEEMTAWGQNRQPVCVVAWDIDHFKSINDRYGHGAGDKVLVVVAELLAAGIRGTDFVARYGGEEFAMVLPGTSITNGIAVANQIRDAISETGFHFRGSPVAVTISCGITELIEGDTASTAFDRADQALYKAKNGGRNKVVRG